jgi:gamma-glutamyltranspeptidase
MGDAEQPTTELYREVADRLRELAKHHRRKGTMRNQRVREPMIVASARGHEILQAQVAVIEQRLRQTVGATRPWTDDDYTRTAKELLREGILDSRAVIAELLPELTIID